MSPTPTITQLLLATTLTVVAWANANAEQLLNKPVSLNLSNVTLEAALLKIEGEVDVRFMYSPDLINLRERVSIIVHLKPLRQVLDDLFNPLHIRYKVNEREKSIALKAFTPKGEESTLTHPRQQTPLPVSGKVTEAAGNQPLPGVNILIKGTTIGTTTDATGTFTLDAPAEATLVFSFIGYKTVEVAIAGRTSLNIVLEIESQSLDEVVINAGYWTVTDKQRTGSIARITAEEIQRQPVNNPLMAMQGRMTGVQITQHTGLPGSGFTVRIRGTNSLRPDANDPLYIIDGVPFTSQSLSYGIASSSVLQNPSPLASINPADIESIEVLKDADATAIYGSRGANGVILITTKKATSGKTSLELTTWQGIGRVSRKMEMLNTHQYLTMRKEAMQNDGYWPLIPSLQHLAPDLFAWDTTRYTDWQEELFGGTAQMSNAQLALSGGTNLTQYSLRSGLYRETTVFPGSQSNTKASGLFHLNHRSENSKLILSLSTSFLSDNNNLIREDLTRYALALPPVAPPLYDDLGKLYWGPSSTASWTNPLARIQRPYAGKTRNLNTNLMARYALTDKWELSSSFGYNLITMREFATTPLRSLNPYNSPGTTSSVFTTNEIETWIVEPKLRYASPWGTQHKVESLLGATFQQSIQQGDVLAASGYTNDALLRNKLAAATLQLVNADYNQYRYAAVFARVNYTYADKYILNLTGRRDGSSRFGPNNRFGNFGAIGMAWLFAEENLFKNSFISSGKLRLSHGTTGSDNVGNYAYLATFTPTPYPYQNVRGVMPARHTNPNYSWETNRKSEVALESGFFQNRILLQTAYFHNVSSNQLVQYPLPALTGFPSVVRNMPATIRNSGWELELTTHLVEKPGFSWSASFNATIPQNKLVKFDDLENSPYANEFTVGHSLYARKRYAYDKLNPESGVYTFVDLDDNGFLNYPGDLAPGKIIGQLAFGGIRNSLTWKNLALEIFIQMVHQNATTYRTGYGIIPGSMANQPASVWNRWQNPGDQADVQRYTFFYPPADEGYENMNFSDGNITDASFMRLKNISLHYSLPASLTQSLHMSRGMITLQGQNLATKVWNKKFVSLDPETGSNSLPPLQVLTLGIQLVF